MRSKGISRGIFRLKITAVCLLAVLLWCAGAWAQETTGSIAGTVKDPSGAVVPNAAVTLTNTGTNVVVRTVKTGAGGDFSAPLLPIGRYLMVVEAPGFQKFVQTGIVLNAGDKLAFNPTLKVGSSSQEVTVAAAAAQVELQSPQAAALVTGTQVRELALNGRNWVQLMTLTPGVSDAGQSDVLYVGAFAPQGTNLITFTMNGGRREQNNYMIDGADNVDRGSNLTLLAFPSVDSIAEFRVLRGQYDPEYGRAASGQVNVITRSGTSSLHGNLYEFWRNDALNARPFASKYPVVTPHIPYLRYHDFGGTIGGPVYIPKLYEQKNKTFFFFSEEARRNLSYVLATAEVPTTSMLSGQFAHPVCVTFSATNTCTGTATSIPTASFGPITQAYLKDIYSHYPAPSGVPGDPFGFTSTLRNVFNFREEILKIDHIVSQKLSLSGKILRDTIPTQEAGALFSGNGPAVAGIGTTSTNSPGHNYTVRATITLNPSFLIEPGYAYSYGAILSDPIGLTTLTGSPDVAAAVKLPFKSTLARVPNLTFTGATPNPSTLSSGPGSYGPYRDYNRNHTVFGNATKIVGSHTIKFGGTYYHYNKQENAASTNAGVFAFNTTGIPTKTSLGSTVCGNVGQPACPASFEQSWANFLLGRVGTFTQTSFDLTANIMDNQFEYYLQDTWRVKPNFTVTYGFRHSLFRQPTDANGLLGQFDPASYDPAKAPCVTSSGALDLSRNAAGQVVSTCNPNYDPLNGYIFAHPPAGGKKSPYGDKVGKEYNRGIAPRVGFAWDPWSDGKTSIRAGFGMFYDNGQEFGNAENNIFLGTGFVSSYSVSNSTLQNPTGGATATSFPTSAGRLQSRVPIDYKYPYTTQWSLDFQRELARGLLLDVGYYGNNGIHLPGFIDINQPPNGAYLKCTDATPCKSGSNNISFTQVVNGVPITAVTSSFGSFSSNFNKLNALRPFIGYAGADAFREIYTSNYSGLQAQLQKQFSANSLINVSYTWSHCLTTYQADRSTGSIMPVQGDMKNNYGPCIGDRRHILTANFVWDLPWYRTQHGFIGHILGGWELSGIQTFQTGLPATVASNQLVDPSGADCLGPSPCVFRANQVGDPSTGQPRNFENWFNAAAFTDPQPGQTTIPSERPGALRLPGYWRTDMSLFKNIKFTERFTGQLRLESFNTFNHLNPICCASFTTNNANYNKIRSARDPRILELGMKVAF